MMKQFDVPITFLVFNRPDTTIRVFEAIRHIRPRKLLVVADGPRADHRGEEEKCAKVRAILAQIDWPCEVLKNYSDVNLGCRKRVSSGLDWVFEHVEESIILEDDCLPHVTFFRFCEELLEKYRNDERIGIISGDNFNFGMRNSNTSYYFSRYTHIWGWASWRRTWHNYDVEMKLWPLIKDSPWLTNMLKERKLERYWTDIFDAVYRNRIDTWDYQLNFATWLHSNVNIMPNDNLVTNIGFGTDASRTKKKCKFAEIPVSEMIFPLVHPQTITRDVTSDKVTEEDQFSSSIITSIKNRILSAIL